jgi:hypothetical protein
MRIQWAEGVDEIADHAGTAIHRSAQSDRVATSVVSPPPGGRGP